MTLDNLIKEIEERADRFGSMRSDDFGHSTQDLLLAESSALQDLCNTDIPRLCKALRYLRQAAYSSIEPFAKRELAITTIDNELLNILKGESDE